LDRIFTKKLCYLLQTPINNVQDLRVIYYKEFYIAEGAKQLEPLLIVNYSLMILIINIMCIKSQ